MKCNYLIKHVDTQTIISENDDDWSASLHEDLTLSDYIVSFLSNIILNEHRKKHLPQEKIVSCEIRPKEDLVCITVRTETSSVLLICEEKDVNFLNWSYPAKTLEFVELGLIEGLRCTNSYFCIEGVDDAVKVKRSRKSNRK